MLAMEECVDFITWLGPDMSIKILMHLDNPSDIIRASLVSSSWHQFVIVHDLCKQLCLTIFPEIASIVHLIEGGDVIEPLETGPSNFIDRKCLERNHRIYAFLARGFSPCMRSDCISMALSASSTDNYPQESIQHTLFPSDRIDERASYWSSKGQSNPTIPEILIYKLVSNLCIVTEINLQPFQAYFQYGFPIYSAKSVRFSMGYLTRSLEEDNDLIDEAGVGHEYFEESFIWTYTSPKFLMEQKNSLQNFKLPEPVLCIGGFLRVELVGRVQKQEMDDLYYICLSHVQLVGRPLLPPFEAQIVDHSGKCLLRYHKDVYSSSHGRSHGEEQTSFPSRMHPFTARFVPGRWGPMALTAILAGVEDDEDSDMEL